MVRLRGTYRVGEAHSRVVGVHRLTAREANVRYRVTHATGPTTVRTTEAIRDAVDGAFKNPDRIKSLPPLAVVSVDHYTSKWTVAAIEWLRRRKIVDHILDRPSRICIQVLEDGMLPHGRF